MFDELILSRYRKNSLIAGCVFLLVFCNIFISLSLGGVDDHLDEASFLPASTQPHTKNDANQPSKIRTLVTTQLPGVKSHHYKNYLMPSWKRLIHDRTNTKYSHIQEKVLPDLFIACAEEVCNQIEQQDCFRLHFTKDLVHDKSIWRDIVSNRSNSYDMRCFYADVSMNEKEEYKFIHSLQFLDKEPFLSIYESYDYILRTDADAILFHGLLYMAPANDGWIGAGYYGEEITHHLVRYTAKKYLDEKDWGKPLRNATATPSMQSTFYVSSKKILKFVRLLIHITRQLYSRAFNPKTTCPELTNLNITQEIIGKKYGTVTDICKWPFFHKGVASLYGTRIATDYTLENVTVTSALDALATVENSVDRPVTEVIQVHLLNTKKVDEIHAPDINICLDPRETVQKLRLRIAEENKGKGLTGWSDPLLLAMEALTYNSSVPATIHHQTAEYFWKVFRTRFGCNAWPYHDLGEPKVVGEDGSVKVTDERYHAMLREIEWLKNKSIALGSRFTEKERLEKELKTLESHSVFSTALNEYCKDCLYNDKLRCHKRVEHLIDQYHLHSLVAHIDILDKHPQCRKRTIIKEDVPATWCGACLWRRRPRTLCDMWRDFKLAKDGSPKDVMLQLMKDSPQCEKKV